MSLPPLERLDVALRDFCEFIGLRQEALGGLSGVALAPLGASRAPAWLIEYRLADFEGLHGVRSLIPIPDAVERSVPARQATFLFGRIAARAAVLSLIGRIVAVPVGPRGAPLWPEGLTGSISHTGTHAAAWVERSDDARIGIDVERTMSRCEAEELSGQIMSADEAKLLAGVFGGEAWPEGVTLLFSAKEAAYKALSPLLGRFIDFREVEIESIDRPGSSLSLRLSLVEGDRPDLPARVRIGFATLGGSILTYAVAAARRPIRAAGS